MSAKFIVEINLDLVQTIGEVDSILREVAEDHHAGDHDIYHNGNIVGKYFVKRVDQEKI